ncbi:Ras-related protein Rab-4A [Diatrype stigma]|uniref:Ras-related protein Rab-4A n=1 Tax=Diatrype stigma TaxID=117547 RepID=A0AAN9U8R8_9PEZI
MPESQGTHLTEKSWPTLTAQYTGLLIAVVTFICVRRRYFSPLSCTPGPFLASFSRLWHLRQIWNGDQNLALIRAHDEYGHFVRLAHDEVSVSHPDGIRRVLLTTLPKGNWYRISSLPDYTHKAPFSMVDPREAKEAKKYLLTGYLQHNVLQSEPAMDESIKKLLAWMDKHADNQKPMDLDKFFTYTAFDIMGEVIFSQPFGFLEKGEDIHRAIAMVWGAEAYVTFIGYFQWIHRVFANPFTTWLGILPMGHMYDVTMAALRAREENADARRRSDLAAHWFRGLERARKDGSGVFDLRCLRAFASSNVVAASETVSAGLQSFVYHLSRQPTGCGRGWQRIRNEIDAARRDGGRCQGAVVSYEDAAELPYLQAAVKEGLRMFGPASMGLPRVAPRGGVTIGDTTFPEGVILSISPWVIHYSKEFWGPDAREFNPDRWFGPDIASREKYFIPASYHYCPSCGLQPHRDASMMHWGAGYASCPGQNVAKIQLLKIAATIVRDYDICQVEPEKEWKWAAHFTAIPYDWPVFIRKREGE